MLDGSPFLSEKKTGCETSCCPALRAESSSAFILSSSRRALSRSCESLLLLPCSLEGICLRLEPLSRLSCFLFLRSLCLFSFLTSRRCAARVLEVTASGFLLEPPSSGKELKEGGKEEKEGGIDIEGLSQEQALNSGDDPYIIGVDIDLQFLHRLRLFSSCRTSASGYVVRRSNSSVVQLSPPPRPASSLKLVSRFTLSATNRGSSTIRNIKRTLAQIDILQAVLTQSIRVGCELVENDTWSRAPTNIPIIGLKELPVSDAPLSHTHVQFAHCYKQQAGWSSVLARFFRGGGTLYDLEFLNDVSGRRIAAFGFHAGFAGAAAGALAYAAQKNGERLGRLEPYPNEQAMVADVKAKLGGGETKVKALIIGALGRCGRGAVDLFRKIGLKEYVCFVRNDVTSFSL